MRILLLVGRKRTVVPHFKALPTLSGLVLPVLARGASFCRADAATLQLQPCQLVVRDEGTLWGDKLRIAMPRLQKHAFERGASGLVHSWHRDATRGGFRIDLLRVSGRLHADLHFLQHAAQEARQGKSRMRSPRLNFVTNTSCIVLGWLPTPAPGLDARSSVRTFGICQCGMH